MSDIINKPDHYNKNSKGEQAIETYKYIESWDMSYAEGNIIKYITRYKYKKLPLYTTFKQTGPRHNPTFKIQVQIPKSKKYIGYGKSKKIAQQDAASQLIKNLNIN